MGKRVMEFDGAKLRRLRKGEGFTMRDLMMALSDVYGEDVTELTIGNWERGTHCPSAGRMLLLEHLFDQEIRRRRRKKKG